MSFITPTPGRMVHYYPGVSEAMAQLYGGTPEAHPLAAVVAAVHDDNLVNLSVCDASGVWHPRANVQLVQPGSEIQPGLPCCRWMPYLVSQADAIAEVQAQQADAAGKLVEPADVAGSNQGDKGSVE